MDEEKTIDEAVDEKADEMKEFEPVAFDEVIKDEPAKETAPVLRSGDPEPADMNMIHKHLDNFLAKIAGETPIDENVRDSTEYWLNRIAEAGGGTTVIANPTLAGTEDVLTGLQVGETKYKVGGGDNTKYYAHHIQLKQSGSNATLIYVVVINTSNEAFTVASMYSYLDTNGFNSPDNVLQATGRFNTTGALMGIYKSSTTNHFGVWAIGAETGDATLIVGHDIVVEI